MGAISFPALQQIISSDPETLDGKAVFKGTSVPVEALFAYCENGALDEFIKANPAVSREQAMAALESSKEWLVTHAKSSKPRKSLLGCMAGTVTILGDIVGPFDEEWDAMK